MFDFSNLEDILDTHFNQKDIYITLNLTRGQAKSGISMPVEISRKIISKGNSNVIKKEIEMVTIPRNTKHNTVINLNGKGNQCSNSKENGDLYVKIKIFGKK